MADIWNKFLRCECPFQCLKEVLKALMVLVGSDNEMLSKQCYWYLQLKTHAVLECHLPVLACSSIGEAVESWPSTKHWCWDFGKCWVQSKCSSSSDCSQWITHGSVIYHTFTGDDLHLSHLYHTYTGDDLHFSHLYHTYTGDELHISLLVSFMLLYFLIIGCNQMKTTDFACAPSCQCTHTHTHTHTVQSYSVWVKLVRR